MYQENGFPHIRFNSFAIIHNVAIKSRFLVNYAGEEMKLQ